MSLIKSVKSTLKSYIKYSHLTSVSRDIKLIFLNLVFVEKDVETVLHLFVDCMHVKYFWVDVECFINILRGHRINIKKKRCHI